MPWLEGGMWAKYCGRPPVRLKVIVRSGSEYQARTGQIGRVLVAGSKQSRGRWNKHYLQFINGSPVLSK
jgi:hypothetical protein